MPQSSLAGKMKLKPGQRAIIFNAPDCYPDELDLCGYTSSDFKKEAASFP